MNDDAHMNQDAAAQSSARVGRNAAALVVARFLGLGLSLAQSAIIFRALGVEQTGHFGFALSFTSLFSVFAVLGINRLLVRDISLEPTLTWKYVWSALAVITLLSAAVVIAIAAVIHVVEPEPAVRTAVLAAAVSVIFIWAVQQPFEALLRAKEHMGLLALVNIIISALKLVGVAAAMLIISQQEYGAATAHAAIATVNLIGLAMIILAAIRVAGWSPPQFDFAFILPRLRECFPYTMSMLFSLLYFKSDLTILQFMGGEVATGHYTPAQRVTEPILMVAGLWGTAVFPALCRAAHVNPQEFAELKATSLRLAILISLPMAAGLALFAEPVVLLLTGDTASFSPTITLLQVLACVTPFFYLNSISQEFFYAARRNWYVTGTYAAAAVLAMTGNLLLIPTYGALAVAFVSVGVNAFICACFLIGLRGELIGTSLLPLLAKSSAACAAMLFIANYVGNFDLLVGVGLGAAVYFATILGLKALSPVERAMLQGMLRARK